MHLISGLHCDVDQCSPALAEKSALRSQRSFLCMHHIDSPIRLTIQCQKVCRPIGVLLYEKRPKVYFTDEELTNNNDLLKKILFHDA